MGYVGNEKGQLETNSTVTSYRVRCKVVDCEAAEVFKPQSMTLVQQALHGLGWGFTPGPLLNGDPMPGHWACPVCTSLLPVDSGPLTAGEEVAKESIDGEEVAAEDVTLEGPG